MPDDGLGHSPELAGTDSEHRGVAGLDGGARVVSSEVDVPELDVDDARTDVLAAALAGAVRVALAEDLDERGDVTSRATVPPALKGTADLVARGPGVLAGTGVVTETCRQVDPDVAVRLHVGDGQRVEVGTVVAELSGPLRSILTAERTMLNILGRCSGVATATAAVVAAAAGTGAVVRDTRKTTPGLRVLEKHAVVVGGGVNHRGGLSDALLVKDNHVAAAGGVGAATRQALAFGVEHGLGVQIEVTSLAEAHEALAAGAEDILLDNFTLQELQEAVAELDGRAVLEASGGVDLAGAGAVAASGVDRIAVGAITHSAPSLDVALDVRS